LGHFPCDVSINFITKSNVGSDGVILEPTSITLNNNGHHNHGRCSHLDKKARFMDLYRLEIITVPLGFRL
jgi:hypothetical protein